MTPQLPHFAVCAKNISDGLPQILHLLCFIDSPIIDVARITTEISGGCKPSAEVTC